MSLVCQTRSVKCKLQLSLIMQQGILWPWLWFGWFGEFTYHHYNFFSLPAFLRTLGGRKSYHVIEMTIILTLWLNLDLAEFISWLCNLWHADSWLPSVLISAPISSHLSNVKNKARVIIQIFSSLTADHLSIYFFAFEWIFKKMGIFAQIWRLRSRLSAPTSIICSVLIIFASSLEMLLLLLLLHTSAPIMFIFKG